MLRHAGASKQPVPGGAQQRADRAVRHLPAEHVAGGHAPAAGGRGHARPTPVAAQAGARAAGGSAAEGVCQVAGTAVCTVRAPALARCVCGVCARRPGWHCTDTVARTVHFVHACSL